MRKEAGPEMSALGVARFSATLDTILKLKFRILQVWKDDDHAGIGRY